MIRSASTKAHIAGGTTRTAGLCVRKDARIVALRIRSGNGRLTAHLYCDIAAVTQTIGERFYGPSSEHLKRAGSEMNATGGTFNIAGSGVCKDPRVVALRIRSRNGRLPGNTYYHMSPFARTLGLRTDLRRPAICSCTAMK